MNFYDQESRNSMERVPEFHPDFCRIGSKTEGFTGVVAQDDIR